MFLKAGAVSLALLVASRLLGLLRESALAAAFGATGLADVVVLMLTLPDWLAGVLASGAFAYVLVPAWAGQTGAEIAATQRSLTRLALAAGGAFAAILILLRTPAAQMLAGGLPQELLPDAGNGLAWSAAAFPGALLAALWATRLQHERDFTGMYLANLVVNLVVIAAIFLAMFGMAPITVLGGGLLAAMLSRLGWLHWRMPAAVALPAAPPALPGASLWGWAVLAAGLPLALPFVARSVASQAGEGALATFNYGWKLVELPLILAVQMVGVLALPMIARAMREGDDARTATAVRASFALAWALACAAAAALLVGGPAVARLLFGWGRMDPDSLALIARWGMLGAWSLLPQAIIAVALNVLASRGQMRVAVFAYACALALLLSAGLVGVHDGGALMLLLDVLLTAVAVAVLWPLRAHWRGWLPWRAIGAGLAGVLLSLFLAARLPTVVLVNLWPGLAAGAFAALAVGGLAWWSSRDVRAALAR
jgi:putative peptidoglycan lipid II flippase